MSLTDRNRAAYYRKLREAERLRMSADIPPPVVFKPVPKTSRFWVYADGSPRL